MNQEIVKPEEFGLEPKSVKGIEDAFLPKIQERNGLTEVYGTLITKELTEDLCKEAGDLRKKLVKVRTGIASIHKTQKAFFLASGKFVDAWKNKETEPVTQMEEKLSEIENHFLKLEEERIEKLHIEREDALRVYEVEFMPDNLAMMPQEAYDRMLNGAKLSYEAAKKAADKKKKEEDEELRVQNLHNERKNHLVDNDLWQFRDETFDSANFGVWGDDKWNSTVESLVNKKKKQEESQRKIKAENDRLKQDAIDREKREKKQKAIRDAEIEKERKARIDAEKELEEREAAENAQIQADLNKKDSEKVIGLISDLESLKTKYEFKSKRNRKMYEDVGVLIDKVVNHIDNGRVRKTEKAN